MVQVKIIVSAAIVTLLSFAAAQTRETKTPDAPREGAVPSFYRDVLPILQQHCQGCHRSGEIGPMPLVTYENARSHSLEIANVVAKKKMTPWFADRRYGHFSNDPSLTPDELPR